MNYTVFKPSGTNKGARISFNTSKVKNNKDRWQERLFVELVPQKGFNQEKQVAVFDYANKKSVMINPTEAGEMLHTILTGIPFQTYHKNGDSGVWIKFAPWTKKRQFGQEGSKGHRVDTVSDIAFGLTGKDIFISASLSCGECQCLKVLLESYIKQAMAIDASELAKEIKKRNEQKNQDTVQQ